MLVLPADAHIADEAGFRAALLGRVGRPDRSPRTRRPARHAGRHAGPPGNRLRLRPRQAAGPRRSPAARPSPWSGSWRSPRRRRRRSSSPRAWPAGTPASSPGPAPRSATASPATHRRSSGRFGRSARPGRRQDLDAAYPSHSRHLDRLRGDGAGLASKAPSRSCRWTSAGATSAAGPPCGMPGRQRPSRPPSRARLPRRASRLVRWAGAIVATWGRLTAWSSRGIASW